MKFNAGQKISMINFLLLKAGGEMGENLVNLMCTPLILDHLMTGLNILSLSQF